MVLSYKERSRKLRTVSDALGFDHPLTLLSDLIQNVAPQEEHGHCANCDTHTVESVLVLAGL